LEEEALEEEEEEELELELELEELEEEELEELKPFLCLGTELSSDHLVDVSTRL